MRVLFLLLLFYFTNGHTPNTITLEIKEFIPINESNLTKRYYLDDPDSEFWIVIYVERGYWHPQVKPFETEDEALFFANEIDIRFISIRHVEPALKLHLNVTKVRRVVEEEIREWVK